jgi:hypothetical protein
VRLFEDNFCRGLPDGQRFRTLQALVMNTDDDPLKAGIPKTTQHVFDVSAESLGGYIDRA